MKKVIVGILLATVLFVAGSAAAELVYCAGYTQGAVDGFAATWGPPPIGWSPNPVNVKCQKWPNDPLDLGMFDVPRFYVGNWFDKVVNEIRNLF